MPKLNYTQFDPAQSMLSAQQMAGSTMQLQNMQQQSMRNRQVEDIREQAVSTGYNIEDHKNMLMDGGFFEEALDLQELADNRKRSEQEIMEAGFNILNKTAQVTTQVGESAWPMLRKTLIQSGFASEETLPADYNEQAQKIAAGLIGNTDKVLKVLKMRSGDTEQHFMTQGGQILKAGKPFKSKVVTKDTRSAFEKQVDSYSKTLMDRYPGLKEKDARFLASDVFIHSKEMTDVEAQQRLFQTALRATLGDSEEARKIANEGLELRQELKQKRMPENPRNTRLPNQPRGNDPLGMR